MDALILSYALDTNGQNARYGRAADKFGDDTGVLRALAIGKVDPGGVVGRFQIAAEKLGTLRIRSAHRAVAYFDFPTDLIWDRNTQREVKELVDGADLIHLNNSDTAARRFRVRKPMLLHHHGSLFRQNPAHWLAVARQSKMIQATSTLDLTKPDPKVLHWLPTAYDVAELRAFGEANRREPDGRIRIVSCPTNREYKATDALIAAVKELQAKGLPVDLELIEGKTWRESLRAKAQADIVFDQLLWGYGCNAVEAWAMGIPVISGGDAWTLARMRQEFGSLPFYEASEHTLADDIRVMVDEEDTRIEFAERGTAHVLRYHDELPALTRLAELYHDAMTLFAQPRIPGKAVTFSGKRPVYLEDGTKLQFPATVEDPNDIARLRYLATRSAFGIKEEVA